MNILSRGSGELSQVNGNTSIQNDLSLDENQDQNQSISSLNSDVKDQSKASTLGDSHIICRLDVNGKPQIIDGKTFNMDAFRTSVMQCLRDGKFSSSQEKGDFVKKICSMCRINSSELKDGDDIESALDDLGSVMAFQGQEIPSSEEMIGDDIDDRSMSSI